VLTRKPGLASGIGKALVFPRALLPQVKAQPKLARTGVYLLLGPRPDGEGDPPSAPGWRATVLN